MKLKHENYEHTTVISMAGEVNTDEIAPLEKLLNDRLAAEARDFVLDLSQTEFLDSKALEMLLWLQKQADDRLGQVRLVQPTDNVQKILQITRLEQHFDRHDSVEAALKSLK